MGSLQSQLLALLRGLFMLPMPLLLVHLGHTPDPAASMLDLVPAVDSHTAATDLDTADYSFGSRSFNFDYSSFYIN